MKRKIHIGTTKERKEQEGRMKPNIKITSIRMLPNRNAVKKWRQRNIEQKEKIFRKHDKEIIGLVRRTSRRKKIVNIQKRMKDKRKIKRGKKQIDYK